MKVHALVLVLGVSACGEAAVELELTVGSSDLTSFDVGCVTAVDILPHEVGDPNPLDIGLRTSIGVDTPECVDITPQTSISGVVNALRGKISMPMPEKGLGGIQIRGRTGSCADPALYYEAIFYGGAGYSDGQDSLAIALRPNISCANIKTYTVKPVDLFAITASATHECTLVTDALATFPGNVRPTSLGDGFDPLMFEAGPDVGMLEAGKATLTSFASAAAGTCIAVAHEGTMARGATCVNASATSLCAAPGEIEIPIVPNLAMSALDGAKIQDYGPPLVGAAWEKAPNKPIAGATVTPTDPNKSLVVYVEPMGGVLREIPNATSTGPSGMFIVYSRSVTNLTIAAPGHTSAKMFAGGAFEIEGTMLAVLPKL